MHVARTLLLIRHGTTAYNAADRLQGRIDLALNRTGQREARALQEILAHEPLDLVVSSPMKRALETARIAIGDRDVPFQIENSFVEIDIGEWEGRKYASVRGADAGFFSRWRADAFVPIPGGESFSDVCERVRPGVEALLESPARCVLVSGHATVNRAILCRLMKLDPQTARRFRVLNASLSRINLEEGPTGPVALLESWNLTHHLEKGK
ncbi:MAG: histidine phosphatase family protein [Acidobacteriota bacterium]|jgi:probable phosphoglycerate mutase|nr:histidine phosphatase family protein [Acidobacteriota bacterium]